MFKKISLALTAVCVASLVFAGEQPTVAVNNASTNTATINNTTHFDAAKLKAKLTLMLGLEIDVIKPSAMPGLVELVTNQGLFYASADGKFFIQGKLYGLGGKVVNYSEESLAQVRLDGMDKFADSMIVYPAKNEKHVVTVFTDITCGYCRKMHEQMDEYNDKGITVRYLAYPRSGVKDRTGQYSQGFKDLRSIWCHEDPADALTKAKMGSNVAQRICDKPIEDEFNFGRQVGVSGTPAVILENGMMLPGYQEPDALIGILEQMKVAG
ncbi:MULTISPECIES: bifunctional protein-disulfide isomerase/oxidoreductase DsbC [unclassified Colwellia]|uniref:bifunctional protein-disulfide isomerase/oxidoreductase DsbC n=1 Tax=unclassified Colwellia TaxID=196834 RepID=UPI0015F4B14A|nr:MULTISPECIES: bifunctional protein-disulfide isomerase/oxidoreductase DsbC [unclassified Colwellia]MBA6230807.1 bifunctional protein-disulfide isomerase/oxidoreductase DsbC [Colwellia sp. MB02u-7]MBA6234738.1 bifunctional protein-disulfide isomerase/oxidoreductase DsbC [Colwellia sp. MB02u-11]MBA6255601.1 bifunctional protein-disulfide isomerase/oxidoreductase DsbC [Colwellia sp. MB3u-28]MBA6261742.1 bifunctional protein-disulfide isomerase/oxidoreductase DsbC [Colwellia sp. MB3u-41]MBA6301